MSDDNNLNENIFKDIYNDFFGEGKKEKKYNNLKEEFKLSNDVPEITLNNDNNLGVEDDVIQEDQKENNTINDIDKEDTLSKLLEKIDGLYITDESKQVLIKIVNYMYRYNKKESKQYIPFNIRIYSDNKESLYSVVRIISDASKIFSYIKSGDEVEVSLYNLEKVDELGNIYDSKYNIIVFKDFNGLISQEQSFKDKFVSELEYKIEENPKEFITILSDKNKETINQIISKSTNLVENVFKYEITTVKPDVQDIYQEIIEKLNKEGELSEEFKVKLLDYISITYPNTTLNYNQYKEKVCEEIIFNKKDNFTEDIIPKYQKDKSIEEIFQSLNELVGLEKVKQMLQDLVSLIELKNKAKDDLKIKDTNLHMVFLGNPGTGKTTVARIVAEILYNLKYIKQNKLIEVSSKDLVAEYVGQTAPKTMSVIEKALGGVLFIDEAYSLASGSGQGNSYNEEAIATLIQAMENYRDNLVVIFAGYTKEMQAFLNANSGIVSRIGYTVEFEDYTVDELIQIFNSMMKKSGFIVEDDAIEKVKEIINEYKETKNFGNARFVRNVYEKTIIKHASNTKGKKRKDILKTIKKDDISTENLLKM
mgnify:CR=1 FL=1